MGGAGFIPATLLSRSIMGGRYCCVVVWCGFVQPHLRILTDVSVRYEVFTLYHTPLSVFP